MGWEGILNRLGRDVHSVFKLPAIYMPKFGGKLSTEVNLRKREVEVDNGNGGTVFTEMTEAVFLKCEVRSIVRGDRFSYRNEEYVITDISGETVDTIAAFVDKQ